MKLSTAILSVSAIFIVAGASIAQEATTTVPAMPAPAIYAPKNGVRPMAIGPKDSGRARVAKGKLNLVGFAPKEVNPAVVEIFVDDKSIGTADKRPFGVEFDTTTVADGEHTVKAVGKDTAGKEVWAASSTILVANKSEVSALQAANPQAPITPVNPIAAKPKPLAFQPVAAPASSASLDKTYTSGKYGFSIRFPGIWKVSDQTVNMKPKSKGGCWIVFDGSAASKNSKLVVNLRRAALQPGTDADTFAKFNDYVQKWDRKTIQGSTAFVTSAGTAEAKRVVHRAIVIRDGSAWMLNCIDSSGKPAAESAKLFEEMINTLQPTK